MARQWLGSVGKVDNGIVAVTSVWADERIYYPLHVQPYTPESRLAEGKKDPHFRTKPQRALDLIAAAQKAACVPFRAVVADSAYGDNANFEQGLWEAGPLVRAQCQTDQRHVGAGWERRTRPRKPRGDCAGVTRGICESRDKSGTVARGLPGINWYR